ncbi:MAG: hypothetical protein ACTH2X_00770 [Brachybacterium tyrofermentans]
MKKLVIWAAVGSLVLGAMMFGATVMIFQFMMVPAAQQEGTESANGACSAPAAPALTVDAAALPEVPGYTPEQLAVAAQIMQTAKALELPERAQLIGIMTAMQESTLGVNTQPTGSGNDSGIFQQRTLSGWYGSTDEILDPSYAATAFFQGVTAESPGDYGSAGGGSGHGHLPGLVDIEGWESMPLGQAAQKVQRSAYPDEYATHETAAREIMAAVAGVPVSAASGSLTDSAIGCAGTTVAAGDLPTQEQLTQPSADVACPDGSTDLGAGTGGYRGSRIPIRLCSITGTVCTGSDCGEGEMGGRARGEVVLNSLVAPHFIAWLEAVRADGQDPQFSSSYRSWETQLSLSGSSNAAGAGWSNHQMGAAVDISGLPGGYSRHNCAGFTPEGSCKALTPEWQSYNANGIENGALFHDEEFWHLEWIITRAPERSVPFIQAA